MGAMEHAAIGPLLEIPRPWRYLSAVGVDPAFQGQGYGTVLVRKVVADARAAGIPCGLVTDGARNVPLYERCGFRVIREMLAPDGKTRVWTMLAE
jgi:GNAT superfamily N-acetyltransferase